MIMIEFVSLVRNGFQPTKGPTLPGFEEERRATSSLLVASKPNIRVPMILGGFYIYILDSSNSSSFTF